MQRSERGNDSNSIAPSIAAKQRFGGTAEWGRQAEKAARRTPPRTPQQIPGHTQLSVVVEGWGDGHDEIARDVTCEMFPRYFAGWRLSWTVANIVSEALGSVQLRPHSTAAFKQKGSEA